MVRALFCRLLISGSMLLLLVVLAGCGGNSSTRGSTQATATARTVTATARLTFATYHGPGFTLRYPLNWQTTSLEDGVAFADTSGNLNMTIGSTPNPNGAASPDKLAEGGLAGARANLQNPRTLSVPATMTINGQPWSQRALSGTSTLNGQHLDVEVVVLATNHPPFASATVGYVLVYIAPKNDFSRVQSTYFMPMLQSLQFTS